MDTLECIKTRRSIRRFTDQPIPDEVLYQILEAVKWAPSWANTQTWEIILVKDRENVEKIAALVPESNPAYKGLFQAPVIAVICAKLGLSGYKKSELLTELGDWYMFDAGIAAEHLCLAAHALGLGTVHVGTILSHKALDEILGLPEDIKSIEIIPIGYPAKEGNAPPRREISEFVHSEKYGQKINL